MIHLFKQFSKYCEKNLPGSRKRFKLGENIEEKVR